jgi:hypothetical protein
VPSSVFFQFESPDPAAWFYATLVLAVAIYFQFGRVLCLRNLDLLGLFLFAPGFLLIEDAHRYARGGPRDPSVAFLGYVWLFGASGYWFLRCLLDVTAVRRPRVAVNLSPAGLCWLAGALLLGLGVATALQRIEREPLGKRPAQLSGIEEGVASAVQQVQPAEVKGQIGRGIAVACQVAVVILTILIGTIHFREFATGVSAAALYLLLPATSYRFDQSHHVWPTALLLGAFLSYRRPIGAGVLFGLAVGTSFFPIVLLPVWLQFYRGRGQGVFLIWFAAFALLGLAVTVPALVFGGETTSGIWQTLNLADWQPWGAAKSEGIWSGVHWAYRLPVFIAFVALVIGSAFWPTARDLGQLLAASSALLIGIQFWFADCGGAYVLWYAPFLILMILRPSTVDLQPPQQESARLLGWLRRRQAPAVASSPSLAV